MLEGEAYWGRIKGVRNKLYAVELVLTIVMGGLLVATSKDFSTSPFLLPCEEMLWLVLVMLLVFLVESIFFRVIQLRMAGSDSVKYIIATNSIKKAVIVIIIMGIIAALLLIPGMIQGIESSTSYHGTATPGHPARFQNKDLLGLSSVASVSVTCNGNTSVYLVSQFLVNQYPGEDVIEHPLNPVTNANPYLTIDMTPFSYSDYYIYVAESPDVGNATEADFTLNVQLTDTITNFLPIVAIVFVISNAVWVEYLLPFRRKCRAKSIYK